MFEEFEDYKTNNNSILPANQNVFYIVTSEQLKEAEARAGINIPPQLKEFYVSIGWGAIRYTKDGHKPSNYSLNYVVDPNRLADLYLRKDPDWLAEEICDEGEMPFFDCGDQLYLVMKPHSDNPDAVYWSGEDTPIVESFEEFMIKLHKNPRFYIESPYNADA